MYNYFVLFSLILSKFIKQKTERAGRCSNRPAAPRSLCFSFITTSLIVMLLHRMPQISLATSKAEPMEV